MYVGYSFVNVRGLFLRECSLVVPSYRVYLFSSSDDWMIDAVVHVQLICTINISKYYFERELNTSWQKERLLVSGNFRNSHNAKFLVLPQCILLIQ